MFGGRRMRFTAGAVAFFLAVAGVAAWCATRDSGPAGGRAADEESGDMALRPLTTQESSLLHRAEQILLRDCMRKRGFTYRMVPENPIPEAREFPYVIDDVTWARQHGYGSDIDRKVERIRAADPNQKYFRSLSPERRAAALVAANGARPKGLTALPPDGVRLQRSDEGCRTESERALYGDVAAWFEATSTTEALPDMARRRVIADPRFSRATRPWSACMREAGHSYATPADLREKLPPRERARLGRRLVPLAVTEAECARSSGLARVANELDHQYRRQLERQYRRAVETEQRLQLAALTRARPVIADGGA
ncbi:hypothetical protein ACMA1D_15635 [Streptomyces sp. 796.1]|uniref:hypothetical protein n=1 Tax=Streptomyces sp. 796.1 TaxID=3163029 RepID=UPI0039C96E0F